MTQKLRICNPKNKTSTLKAQNIDNHQIQGSTSSSNLGIIAIHGHLNML